jgi:predicted amidohydrolase YtcJ
MALRRYDPSWGPDAAPFGPRERLTLDRALRAATVGPAATTLSPDLGRLVPGCRADLIVLPPVPVAEGASAEAGAALGRVRPRLVMLDGEVVVER